MTMIVKDETRKKGRQPLQMGLINGSFKLKLTNGCIPYGDIRLGFHTPVS
jgi:hypothetical protein